MLLSISSQDDLIAILWVHWTLSSTELEPIATLRNTAVWGSMATRKHAGPESGAEVLCTACRPALGLVCASRVRCSEDIA